MRLRHPIAALLPVLAALALGCGGDAEEKNAYVEDVQVAQRAFVTRFEQVLKRLTATSTLAQDAATLGAFDRVTARFVTALKEVEAPAEVREQHGRLVAAVVGYQREVERASARLRRGSREDQARVRTELSSSVEGTQARIARAIADINTALRG